MVGRQPGSFAVLQKRKEKGIDKTFITNLQFVQNEGNEKTVYKLNRGGRGTVSGGTGAMACSCFECG